MGWIWPFQAKPGENPRATILTRTNCQKTTCNYMVQLFLKPLFLEHGHETKQWQVIHKMGF